MRKQIHRPVLLERLPDRVLALLRAIGQLGDERGCQVYVVGGVVRDLLMGHVTLDLDLAVEGDGITFARAVADRYRTGLAVFERFATARLVFPDMLKMDIATTRRESYAQPADLPTVQPASMKEDLYRRDFTINAMAVQLNPAQFGQLLDEYGGRHDLRARTIRVLHAGSFQDDPTRIFRAIRFEQRFKFRLERGTCRLLVQAASTNLIQQLSGPRLQNEMLSLLGEKSAVRAIARLSQLKLLRFLHRRLCYTANVQRVVIAVPKALAWWGRRVPDGVIDKPLIYLMALSSESSPAVVAAMIRRLALSREQAKKVSASGRPVDRALKKLTEARFLRPSQVYHLLVDLPDEALVLLLAKQLVAGPSARVVRLKRYLTSYMKSRMLRIVLTGHDLQALGLQPGPQYAVVLGQLLDGRIDGVIASEGDERDFVLKRYGRFAYRGIVSLAR